jgi:Sec-independent protein secretion pathway component TatC
MKKMTLMQHFSELKQRILWVFLLFVVFFVCGWYVAPWMQSWLTQPLLNVWSDGMLLYAAVTDGLMIQFSLAALFANGWMVCSLHPRHRTSISARTRPIQKDQ